MQARLKVLHDKANVKQVKLLPVTLIGRSTECNLKIASSQVSRNHCRITLGTDSVFVEDLGSANGTLVDGQLIPAHQPTAIAPGARLIVGPAEFQIDFVASTSTTMVLPRTGVPPVPELPSTEMIFPPTVAATAPVVAPTAPIPAVAPFLAPVEVAAPEPAPALVAPVIPAPAVVAEAAAFEPMPPSASDTVNLEPGQFPMADETPDESEQTVFMFQETVPDTIPVEPASKAESGAKKGGLKSLFSMFGRKEKPIATHSGSAPAQPAAAPPSIFLPTVEAASAPPEAAVPAIAVATSEPEATSEATEEAPAEEDDGFQQFLSNL